jgi:hypothetical protein
MGTFGQFIYDFNCIMDSRKEFDIILQLGYTSNSIWFFLLPKTNYRNQYGWFGVETDKIPKPVRQFLKFAERLAVFNSDF